MKWPRFAMLFAVSLLSSARAQTVDTAKQVYDSANPSVFLIYLNDISGKPIAFGSGFEIAPRTIATNAHVVSGGSPVLAFGPVRIPATVAKLDTKNDLAILTVDADLTSSPLNLAGGTASPGEQVFAIGNPEGLEKTISQGIVSGVRTEDGRSLLQITSPISHGSSGGPVLNSHGEVIGVAVGMFTEGQNLNFAVPVSYLRTLVASKGSPGSAAPLTASELGQQIADLTKEPYSNDASSGYQTKLESLRSTIRANSISAKDATTLHEIFCAAYSQAPDSIGDAVVETGRKLLSLKGGPPSEVHAVIAYDLAVEAEASNAGPERSNLIAESKKEALQSLTLGKQGNGTADYVLGHLFDLDKNYPDGLKSLKRAITDDSKRFACGYNLSSSAYRELIVAEKDSGNYQEAERLFQAFAATADVNGFDWDAEGDRRADHSEYLEAASAYQKSEGLLPINACYSAFDYAFSTGDHSDSVLSEGRKCFDAASKLSSAESITKANILSRVHGVMAEVLNSRGVYTEALSHAKDSISLDPKYAWGYYQEATSSENLNRSQECISAAQQAIILSDGKFGSYHFLLGSCYFDAENWGAAETSFRNAAEKDKGNAAAAFNLGLAYKRQGYGTDAKQWFEEALKRNPDNELRTKILSVLR